MKVAIFGGTGLLGFALANFLKQNNADIHIISTKPEKYKNKQKYSGFRILSDLDETCKYNIIINLAGKSIFTLWTKKNKELFLTSRTYCFDKIKTFTKQHGKADLIINGSAIGIYAQTANKVDEYSPVIEQNFFSQHLCKSIELKSQDLLNSCNQLINIRTGVVFAGCGGFLSRLLPSFKFGFGAAIASGKQYISWIDIDDFCRAIAFIIHNSHKFKQQDFINLTSPEASTNLQISKEISKALKRPCFFKIPQFVIKTLFGKMGAELMLASQQVYPKKLIESGFKFLFDTSYKSIKSKIY